MDITFNCEKCGQPLTIDESGSGQLVDCPKCATPLEVPNKSKPSATENTRLPHPLPPPRPTEKKCPFCAEKIKTEAKVCRFYGYDFVTRQRAATSSTGSPSPLPKILTVLVIVAILVGGFFAYHLWRTKVEAPFLAAAKEALEDVHKMESADENGLNYEQYGTQLIALASKKDNLMRVADATGKRGGTDEDKFCTEIIEAHGAYWTAGESWALKIKFPHSESAEQEMQKAWHEASEAVAKADKLYSKFQ